MLLKTVENFGQWQLADRSMTLITIINKLDNITFIFTRQFSQEPSIWVAMNSEDRTELLESLKASKQRFLTA